MATSRPKKVILFGSYARAEADEGSDVDILVIEPKVSDKYAEMIRLRSAVRSIGAEWMCSCTPKRKLRRARTGAPASSIYWALREGEVLYEAR